MFETVETLSPERHKHLTFTSVSDMGYARNLQTAPLSVSEVFEAARCFPVVFPPQGVLPHAVLGWQPDENVFVDSAGTWRADYVPAHVRRYPFILRRAGEPETFALGLDPQAPHFRSADGEPLFDANGELGPVVQRARDFLQTYQREIQQSEQLFREVADAGVLVDREIKAGGGEGEGGERRLKGFRCVDEDALRKLDDATFLKWRDNGLLGALYACLLSLRNVRKLAAGQA